MNPLRTIAIYLPQFYPIAQNDLAWGKGFTEWTNVTKAKSLFKGHYQPHLPSDLGFYDLRVPEIREEQAVMAKSYGIDGFCYYHYWFNGERILERPFQEVFETGKPDFPFMLCWANESWCRSWEGKSKEIIVKQNYSDLDDIKHIHHLLPYFKDKRYIKIDNKPVFAIYNSTQMPDSKKTIRLWRNIALQHGIELYICRFESLGVFKKELIGNDGFDAAIDFHPSGYVMGAFKKKIMVELKTNFLRGSKYFFYKKIINKISHKTYKEYIDKLYKRIDYKEYVDFAIQLPFPDYKWFPCITPMWDNTARMGKNALVFKNSHPDTYYKWLKSIVNKFKPYSNEENLVFVNAWNEWAEGNHLEPCQFWGKKYLEATSKALSKE